MLQYDPLTCFFFHDTATTEIYTLSLHDALPISRRRPRHRLLALADQRPLRVDAPPLERSEEHTSELQSRFELVCSLLLEKKKRGPLKTPVPIFATYAVHTSSFLSCSASTSCWSMA